MKSITDFVTSGSVWRCDVTNIITLVDRDACYMSWFVVLVLKTHYITILQLQLLWYDSYMTALTSYIRHHMSQSNVTFQPSPIDKVVDYMLCHLLHILRNYRFVSLTRFSSHIQHAKKYKWRKRKNVMKSYFFIVFIPSNLVGIFFLKRLIFDLKLGQF